MATTGIIDGHNLRWYLDGTAILKATTGSISFSKELKERTHKDQSGSWAEKRGGTKSFSGSAEAYLAEGESFETLWTAFDDPATEAMTMEFTTGVAGDKFFNCVCIVTSIEVTADDNEDVTYSISFEGNGAPTIGTEA